MPLCSFDVALNQDLPETPVDQGLDERAVIPSHRFYPLRVHFVILARICPEQPGVALLVDQQVGEVALFKLERYWLGKVHGHKTGGLSSKIHDGGKLLISKVQHD